MATGGPDNPHSSRPLSSPISIDKAETTEPTKKNRRQKKSGSRVVEKEKILEQASTPPPPRVEPGSSNPQKCIGIRKPTQRLSKQVKDTTGDQLDASRTSIENYARSIFPLKLKLKKQNKNNPKTPKAFVTLKILSRLFFWVHSKVWTISTGKTERKYNCMR